MILVDFTYNELKEQWPFGCSLSEQSGVCVRGSKDSLPEQTTRQYFNVTLSCGQQRVYATRDDVPSETVECQCGALGYRHFFIKYEPVEAAR